MVRIRGVRFCYCPSLSWTEFVMVRDVITRIIQSCQQSWALGMRQHFKTQNRHGPNLMFKMSGKNKFVRIQKFLLNRGISRRLKRGISRRLKRGIPEQGLIGLIIVCLHAVKNVCYNTYTRFNCYLHVHF